MPSLLRTLLFAACTGSVLLYSPVAAAACVSLANCSNHGICSNATCVCDKGWTTHPSDSSPACNYQQKEKLTAFLLSFLIGSTGADWFYLAQGSAGLTTALLRPPH